MAKELWQYMSLFQSGRQKDPPRTFGNGLEMRYFRLIDCTKRSIVKAPSGSPYIALSYVWGALKHDPPCSGPDFGLPGVNETTRLPQTTVKVGEITLASTLPHPKWFLKQSTWATRGWTYQEGLLSKRRLIFTPQKTYFECNNMHIAESVMMPLDVIHLRQNDEDGDLSVGAFKFNNPGSSPVHLKHFISEYRTKALTYPEDTLNAIKGIFMHFGKLRQPVGHLMRVPMVSSINATSYDPLNSFLAGLSWRLDSPAMRRAEFTSWTWAGWDGKLDSRWLLYDSRALASDINKRLANVTVNFIHIKARTFAFQLMSPHWNEAEIYLGDLGLICYRSNVDLAFPREEGRQFAKTLTAIIIGDPGDTKFDETMVIGVEDKGEFAERVGVYRLLSLGPVRRYDYGATPTKEQFVQFLQAQQRRTIRLG
ncbi:hypothetical protein BKA65DRAFT_573949 [Rhexocercosporidium sp. MPI-PUGE-AT-0058]|nr:hypothetical protein BKA65DRAFT_573949 [Rhexocercosporidium sp. MPI-PUGE-AT-0058]